MVAPANEGDIVLDSLVMLRHDRYLPVASTTSGLYWAWTEDFTALPPVEMASNDVPRVHQAGLTPGGDMALGRRYSFELWGEWATDEGLLALMTDLATASVPLQSGTATLAFKLAGVVWTVTGRYEPISLARTDLMIAHQVASWQVRFRATDPVLAGDGAQQLL